MWQADLEESPHNLSRLSRIPSILELTQVSMSGALGQGHVGPSLILPSAGAGHRIEVPYLSSLCSRDFLVSWIADGLATCKIDSAAAGQSSYRRIGLPLGTPGSSWTGLSGKFTLLWPVFPIFLGLLGRRPVLSNKERSLKAQVERDQRGYRAC